MNNVCIVIVTYGNRFKFLKQVIESCLNNGIYRIIIVDNASSGDSITQLNTHIKTKNLERITIIHLAKNTGSAGGFKKGIEEAVKCHDCEYILLLDDDNVILENCVNILVDSFNKLASIYKKDELVLSSHRINLEQLDNRIIKKNVFLGFHFKDMPKKFLKKFVMKRKKYINNTKIIKLDTAPGGGLFFHKSLVQKYGFPNGEFVLYSDDTEFTYRITKNGGKIFFVSEARIVDVDKKMGGEASSFNMFTYFNANKSKIYYGVRNMAYFEVYSKKDKTIIRKFNKLIYFTILRILAIIYGKKERLDIIMDAVRDGESGNLGFHEKYPL